MVVDELYDGDHDGDRDGDHGGQLPPRGLRELCGSQNARASQKDLCTL